MFKKLTARIRSMIFGRSQIVYAWIDYMKYAAGLGCFRGILSRVPLNMKESLLIVSGGGMNVTWAQLWTILSLSIRVRGYRGCVLTTRRQKGLNKYFRLLDLELVFSDDMMADVPAALPEGLARSVAGATTFDNIKMLFYKEMPIGQIALSSYSRNYGTGVIDVNDPGVLQAVRDMFLLIYRASLVAERVYDSFGVKHLFFTEVFMEEYGAFYYTALARDLNIIRFAGTVRDDAFIFQHLTKDNDRTHHASLSPATWERVRPLPFTTKMDAALKQNFLDRYGDKWHRSKRNSPNTRIMLVEEARKLLDVREGRKIAVIYSHILYDTIFFFGTDLFNDYAQWLVETVRAACQNPAVDWFVKVHPSNLWRGELDTLLGGKYEEERLLHKVFNILPAHVRIIHPDTRINPYTWFQLADYGITVRGTAGLEMAALGKTVITAGTGRYEGNGFTTDPRDRETYLGLLRNIQNVPTLSADQEGWAKRYAHAIFVLKPFTLTSVRPSLRTGISKVRASDDLIYTGTKFQVKGAGLPPDLQKLSEWMLRKQDYDLLSEGDGL